MALSVYYLTQYVMYCSCLVLGVAKRDVNDTRLENRGSM